MAGQKHGVTWPESRSSWSIVRIWTWALRAWRAKSPIGISGNPGQAQSRGLQSDRRQPPRVGCHLRPPVLAKLVRRLGGGLGLGFRIPGESAEEFPCLAAALEVHSGQEGRSKGLLRFVVAPEAGQDTPVVVAEYG